ncbi:hypothetical protein [Novosphingobium olei]|uniref:hypothetical protein n=1 Tax=Novosphingobium olei TaxID=2728851 RepID=UPI00308D0674|nr:hypothetical protein NSDW_18300 [Novosphingobium olei]
MWGMPIPFLSTLLAAATVAEPSVAPDSVWVEVGTPGSWDAFAINADATGERVTRNALTHPEAEPDRTRFPTEAGLFERARSQFARFRKAAEPGEGCKPADKDPIYTRLRWRENGQTWTATYSDSCAAMPKGFFETVRPIGQALDRFVPMVVPVPDRP